MRARMTFMPSFLSGLVNILEKDELDDESNIQYLIPTERCTQKKTCRSGFTDALKRLIGLSINSIYVQFPRNLDAFCCSTDRFQIGVPFCSHCQSAMQKAFNENTKSAWSELPSHLHMAESFDM